MTAKCRTVSLICAKKMPLSACHVLASGSLSAGLTTTAVTADRLAVTEAMLLPALEGSSLVDCLTHGRLFTVDLGLLHALKDVNGHEVRASYRAVHTYSAERLLRGGGRRS